MHGQQGLVGGDDGLAGLQRRFDRAPGDAFGAADQFDKQVDAVKRRKLGGVIEPAIGRKIDAAGAIAVARRYGDHFDAAAGRGEIRMGDEVFDQALAYDAYSGDADLKVLAHVVSDGFR